MVATPAGGAAGEREGVVPREPWARWALGLLTVSAAAAVLSLTFPWWEFRTYVGSFSGSTSLLGSTSLWDGQWCSFYRGLGGCHPYSGDAWASVMSAGLAASMRSLEFLHVVVVVASLLACAAYTVPRIRARFLRVPALAGLLATGLAWVAIAYAWIAIPGTEPSVALPSVPGFTGTAWSKFDGFLASGDVWGAGNAWFLLLLVAGTGILALLAMRAAARSPRRSRTASSGVR